MGAGTDPISQPNPAQGREKTRRDKIGPGASPIGVVKPEESGGQSLPKPGKDKSLKPSATDRPEPAAAQTEPERQPAAGRGERLSEARAAAASRAREAELRMDAAEKGVKEAEERLEAARLILREAEKKKPDTRAKKNSLALARIDVRRAEVELEYRKDELAHLAGEYGVLKARAVEAAHAEEVARYGHPVKIVKETRPEDVLREVRAAGYANPREVTHEGRQVYRVEGFDSQGRRFIVRYDAVAGQFERVR